MLMYDMSMGLQFQKIVIVRSNTQSLRLRHPGIRMIIVRPLAASVQRLHGKGVQASYGAVSSLQAKCKLGISNRSYPGSGLWKIQYNYFILNKQRTTKALIREQGGTGWYKLLLLA